MTRGVSPGQVRCGGGGGDELHLLPGPNFVKLSRNQIIKPGCFTLTPG